MFTLDPNPEFTHAVPVEVPVDGGHSRQEMRVTFRVLATAEAEDHDLASEAGTTEFLTRVVVRVEDLVDRKGTPVLWSDAVRDTLLGLPYVRLALVRGYFEGVAGARRKN